MVCVASGSPGNITLGGEIARDIYHALLGIFTELADSVSHNVCQSCVWVWVYNQRFIIGSEIENNGSVPFPATTRHNT